jgi:hypothetical protein
MNDVNEKKRKTLPDDESERYSRKSRLITDEPHDYCGFTLEVEIETGTAISLHSRSHRDKQRWHGHDMPSLEIFPDLRELELYKCRYITSIHETLSQLKHLRVLKIIGCSQLQSIPTSIDRLAQLEEVSDRLLLLNPFKIPINSYPRALSIDRYLKA